jgi:hypothetical protein
MRQQNSMNQQLVAAAENTKLLHLSTTPSPCTSAFFSSGECSEVLCVLYRDRLL